MKSIIWNGEEMTTIAFIADHYAQGDSGLASEIKPFIRTGTAKIGTLKLSRDEIQKNYRFLEPILPLTIPAAGAILIRVSDVPKLEPYFRLVLEQKSKGTYKKDRFNSNRTLLEEFKLELSRKNIPMTQEEFSAVLSYAARLEKGQPKVYAIREASKKFGVTQKKIAEKIGLLEMQIDYKNKPKDFL